MPENDSHPHIPPHHRPEPHHHPEPSPDYHHHPHHHHPHHHHRPCDELRLECVIVSLDFADILDETLPLNHPHYDTVIIVTSHDDKQTQAVAKKHGAICVETDLFQKGSSVNENKINKGAAINAGFARFQYSSWRVHQDADIIVPDNYRRMLFNHTHLDKNCIYGADRINITGLQELKELRDNLHKNPQAAHRFLVGPRTNNPLDHRYVDTLRGFAPLGAYQLYHASCQKDYPWSLASCQRDDISFSESWPAAYRRLLPTIILYHLVTDKPYIGQNWFGRNSAPLT